MGIAQSVWYRFVNMDSSCEVRVSRDGSVELMSAVQDLGTAPRPCSRGRRRRVRHAARKCRHSDRRHALSHRSGFRRQRYSRLHLRLLYAMQHTRRNKSSLLRLRRTWVLPPDNLIVQNGRIMFKNDASKSYYAEAGRLRNCRQPKSPLVQHAYPIIRRNVSPMVASTTSNLPSTLRPGPVHVEKVFGAHDCGRPY